MNDPQIAEAATRADRFAVLASVVLILGFAWVVATPKTRASGAVQDETPTASSDWPREYAGARGKLVLYEPQIDGWEEQRRLHARLALAYSPGEGAVAEPPVFGAFAFAAETEVDLETRQVKASNFEIVEASFPNASAKDEIELRAKVEELFPADGIVIALDRILANVSRTESELRAVPVASDPPKIFVSQRPAILLLIEGEPILSPIDGDALQFVANTNWDLLFDPSDVSYYLLNEDNWLRASDLGSSWSPATTLPADIETLPEDDNWKQAREHVPGRTIARTEVPIVYVTEDPAELILIDGKPELGMVPTTQLVWVMNTDSDLFYHQGDEHYYYLVAGRWFRTRELDLPDWSFASIDLPEDFKAIPESHPRGDVLASVPGTPQAEEAILVSQIPQRATVERSEVEPPIVVYQGEPEFGAIEGTSLAYATNTSSDVIKLENRYYLCFQGVWFVSASPSGDWELADALPDEIHDIPPSSPVHHTTYVSVYAATPTSVTFGYTSGYVGAYYSWGTVVFGTGFYYPPYYYGGRYPYYYSYPHTYGVGAYYNPYTGTYGRGARAYGPYGGVGRGAAYNPRTGTYARGASAWGPYAGGGWAQAYNPRTGTYGQTRQGGGVYSSWGSSAVSRGDDWARTARVSTPNRGVAGYQTSSGESGVIARGGGNLYAGKDGNVYRRSEGGWERHDGGSWVPSERSRETASARNADRSTTLSQLNRDSQGRAQGASRTQAYRNWNSSAARGGGARAGRGRRR
jgi:hypothetical protein